MPIRKSCDALRYNGTIGVQKSVSLTDDVRQIAVALDHHERIDYSDEDIANPAMSTDDLARKMWHRMSGSSVWLPTHQVYLLVARATFGDPYSPIISFLRGQVFNEDWEPLDNFDLTWGNKTFNFPLMFDVPIPFNQDGIWLGTEDPRIILEDNVLDAEPIVIFNMVAPITDWKRAMYLYRPFTGNLTLLTINDFNRERPGMEKNWAPFFVPQYSTKNSKLRVSNEYIHFVYKNKPLVVLRCHLNCGDCTWAFEQSVPLELFHKHREDGGDLRGGTNFVPVPLSLSFAIRDRVDVWLSFPRTHVDTNCGALYRPELVIMTRVDNQFYLSFASESLSFGSAIVEDDPDVDPCSKGRIMIPMSISRWDTLPHIQIDPGVGVDSGVHDRHAIAPFLDSRSGTDVMTATFSIDDTTVQVARIVGLLEFTRQIPQVKALQKMRPSENKEESDVKNMLSSWVADDIRGCLVESAINYSLPDTGEWRSAHYRPQDGEEHLPEPNIKNEFLLKEYKEKELLKTMKKMEKVAQKEAKQAAEKAAPEENERLKMIEEARKEMPEEVESSGPET